MEYSTLIEMSNGAYEKAKELAKALGGAGSLDKFDENCKKNAKKVVCDLKKMNVASSNGKHIDADYYELIAKATGTFGVINDDLPSRIYNLFDGVKYVSNHNVLTSESFEIGQAVSSRHDTGAVLKYPTYIMGPTLFSDLSIYFLAHEYAHGLKEINSDELKTHFTVSEAIPILCEFIFSFKIGGHENLKRVFSVRKKMIDDCSLIFQKGVKFINEYKKGNIKCNDTEYKDVYYHTLEAGMYLNSFYYAVALFSLFLSDPQTVKNYINHNLFGRMSTSEIIKVVDSTQVDFETLYNTGIKMFNRK